MELVKNKWAYLILLVLYAIFSAWWFYMNFFLPHDSLAHKYYGIFYGVIALWGGLCGIYISRYWGGFRSLLGRAIIMLSLGLFAQEFGQCAYTFYIFISKIDVPYPSIGDIGFFGTIPFYIYAAYLLARVAGVKISLKSFQSKLQAIIIPVIILGIAYALFLRNYSVDLSKPLETFLNFGYPFGQAIYISLGILTYATTRNLLGGVMKPRILALIFAFAAQFIADYMFIFFSDKYYPGSVLDYIYASAYFLMALAIFQLRDVVLNLKSQD